jgi:hypothetical protein
MLDGRQGESNRPDESRTPEVRVVERARIMLACLEAKEKAFR